MALNEKLWAVIEPVFFTPPRTRDQRSLFKGGGPAPPDPYATADAQGKANLEAIRKTAEINRYNSNTPFGSSTWKQLQGEPTLNQDAYDKAMSAYDKRKSDWSTAQAARMATTGGQFSDYGYNGMPSPATQYEQFSEVAPDKKDYMTSSSDKWQNDVTLDPKLQGLVDAYFKATDNRPAAVDFNNLPGVKSGNDYRTAGLAIAGDNQGDIDTARGVAGTAAAGAQTALARANQTYGTEMNFDKAPAMPVVNEAARQQVQDALYQRQRMMLDPRFSEEENALRSRLANSGLTEGSEAYNREVADWRSNKDDAYSKAMLDAITGGGAEQQRQFSMGLAARQQGVSEQEWLRDLVSKEAAAATGNYSTVNNALNQNLSTNLAQKQMAFDLASKGQAQDQATRTNQLNERLLQHDTGTKDRTQLLNELTALVTGSQVTPQGGNVGSMAAAPVAQSIYNSYQGDLNNYNAKTSQQNALLSGLASLGSAFVLA